MLRHKHLEPKFVTEVPRELDEGILYVSMEFGTVLHRCCCGCGEEVVTPLTPTDWKLCFDGVGVSLSPSVGNWNLPCRSHYVIKDNAVLEAGDWSQKAIDAEIRRDRAAKAKYYGQADTIPDTTPTTPPAPADDMPVQTPRGESSMLRRAFVKFVRWLSN